MTLKPKNKGASGKQPLEWSSRMGRLREISARSGIMIDTLPGLIREKFSLVAETTIGRVIKGEKPTRHYNAILKAAAEIFGERFPTKTAQDYLREILGNDSERNESAVHPKPSIAVMPFETPANEPGLEVLADGIRNDIITELSLIRSISTSMLSFDYKNRPVKPPVATGEAGVRYLLTGNLRRSKKSTRISVQLVDAGARNRGKVCWGQSFDTDDLSFAAQDQITGAVVRAVEPYLHLETSDPETGSYESAWALTNRAWQLIDLREKDGLLEATSLIERALRLDPSYALGYAALAYIAMLRFHYGWESRKAASDIGLLNARNALNIDAFEPWAHVALGFVQLHSGFVVLAAQSFKTALSSNESLAVAHVALGATLCYLGRGEEAMQQIDLVEKLNPRRRSSRTEPGTEHNVRASACFVLGKYAQGIEYAKSTINQNPGMMSGYRNLVVNSALAGATEEAKEALQALLQRQTNLSMVWLENWLPYVQISERKRYLGAFSLLGLD